MPCSKLSNRSFSIIEFLIVITILIIVSGISFAVYREIGSKIILNGAVRELITDFRYAQQLAITEQVKHSIRFSTTTPENLDEYRLIRHGETDQDIFVKQLPKGIKFQEIDFTNQEVLFNPYGAVQESGNVVLINSENTTSTIDVRPSGFVQKK